MFGNWIAACCSSSRPVGRNSEERTQKQLVAVIRKASHSCRRPARQLVLWHICGESRRRWNTTGSDTPQSTMEDGKTEHAGKDWKEDYYKTTQDGPEAQTWTDFEKDCDAVNQARASKINDSGYSATQRVFGRNHPLMEDAIFGVRRSRSGDREQATSRRTSTRTVDGYETPCPPSKFSLAPQTSLETSPAPRLRNTTTANCMLDNTSGFGDVERMQPRNQQTPFGTRAWSSATRWPQFGSPTEVS